MPSGQGVIPDRGRWLHAGIFKDRDLEIKNIFYAFARRKVKVIVLRNGEYVIEDRKVRCIIYRDENGQPFSYRNAGRLKIDMITFEEHLKNKWSHFLHKDGSWLPGRKMAGVAHRRKVLMRTYDNDSFVDPFLHNGGTVKRLGPRVNTAHSGARGWRNSDYPVERRRDNNTDDGNDVDNGDTDSDDDSDNDSDNDLESSIESDAEEEGDEGEDETLGDDEDEFDGEDEQDPESDVDMNERIGSPQLFVTPDILSSDSEDEDSSNSSVSRNRSVSSRRRRFPPLARERQPSEAISIDEPNSSRATASKKAIFLDLTGVEDALPPPERQYIDLTNLPSGPLIIDNTMIDLTDDTDPVPGARHLTDLDDELSFQYIKKKEEDVEEVKPSRSLILSRYRERSHESCGTSQKRSSRSRSPAAKASSASPSRQIKWDFSRPMSV